MIHQNAHTGWHHLLVNGFQISRIITCSWVQGRLAHDGLQKIELMIFHEYCSFYWKDRSFLLTTCVYWPLSSTPYQWFSWGWSASLFQQIPIHRVWIIHFCWVKFLFNDCKFYKSTFRTLNDSPRLKNQTSTSRRMDWMVLHMKIGNIWTLSVVVKCR